jgi:hypothetical protein
LKTESTEHLKPRSQYVEEAIQLAMQSRWDEAAERNQFILDNFGADDQTQNRLGKALTELGRLEEAKKAYEASLAINPLNAVAQKNATKLETLLQTNEGLKGGPAKVDLNLFVEEMGKTVVTVLEAVDDPDVCSKAAAGDVAELRLDGDGIVVETVRGVRLGQVEPKLARRLTKLIQGGNRYQAGVTSCEGTSVRIIVRETYQDPKFAGKPSFPMRRRREVDFRPYAKESLLSRDVEIFDEEEEPVESADGGLDLDGLHEVEDEGEPLDFADDAGDVDDVDDDS